MHIHTSTEPRVLSSPAFQVAMEELGILPETHASTSQVPAARPERTGRDAYLHFKKLQRQLEFLNTMEEYVVGTLPPAPSLTTERRATQLEA